MMDNGAAGGFGQMGGEVGSTGNRGRGSRAEGRHEGGSRPSGSTRRDGSGAGLPWSYVLRGLLRHRGSTSMTVGAVALVSVIWMGLHAMILSMQATLEQSGLPERAVVMAREATAENQSRIAPGLRSTVGAMPGVRLSGDGRAMISRELSATTYGQLHGARTQLSLRGVDMGDALRVHPHLRLVAGRPPLEGTAEVVVGRGAADALSLAPGDTLHAWRQRWQVVGVFTESGTPFESEIWTERTNLEQYAGRGHVTSLWLLGRDRQALGTIAAELEGDARLGVQLVSEGAFFGRSAMAARELTLLVYFVSGLLAIGAVLSAVNTLYASITARQGEFAALRAIGFRPAAVWGSVLRESVAMALAGGLLGCLTALAFNGLEFRTLVSGIGFVSFTLRMEPAVLLSGLGFSATMGVLGGVLPARASVARSVVDALQRSATGWLWAVLGPACAGLAFAGVAQAEPGTGGSGGRTDTLRLDLASASVRMLERHPLLLQGRSRVRSERSNLRMQQLGYWPELSVDASVFTLSEAQKFPRFTPDGGLELVPRGEPRTFLLQVEAAQPINGLLSARERVRAAESVVEGARAMERMDRLAAQLTLQGHFLRWAHLREMAGLLARITAEKRTQFEIVSAMVRDSLSTVEQRLAAQSDLVGAEERLHRIRMRMHEQADGVRSLTDVPDSTPLGIDAPERPAGFEAICMARLGWATRQWASPHPERVVIEHSVSEARHRMLAERHAVAPQVTLSARILYSGPPELFGVDLPGLSQVTARAGLVVRYPLRESRATTWRMRALAHRREELRHMLSDWDRRRRDEMTRLEREFDTFCAQWRTALADLDLATERERVVLRELEERIGDPLRASKAREGRLTARLALEELKLAVTDLRLQAAELAGSPLLPTEIETEERP